MKRLQQSWADQARNAPKVNKQLMARQERLRRKYKAVSRTLGQHYGLTKWDSTVEISEEDYEAYFGREVKNG